MGFLSALVAVTLLGSSPPVASDALARGPARPADKSLVMIDANQLTMCVTNRGGFARDVEGPGGPAGLFFPHGSDQTVVYAAGLWMGARVAGDTRVAVADYSMEYGPGRIYPDGHWDSPSDPRLRVYKIVPFHTEEQDYIQWPVNDGAPVGLDGKPVCVGDQTLWSVYNDADAANHTSDSGGSAPLMVEVRQTTFAFDRTWPLGNVVFLKYRIYNRGAVSLDSAYVACWCDPDVGGPDDDLVACDSTCGMGYGYNATNNDASYGTRPPAVAIALLQGPLIPSPGGAGHAFGREWPGWVNRSMTSFSRFRKDEDPVGRSATYNCLQGLAFDGSPVVNPVTGKATRFAVSGSPVEGTGWRDADPGDRRMLVSAGPFTMAPGDSQEVILAVIVAQGSNRLNSLSLAREARDPAEAVVPIALASLSAERTDEGAVIRWEVPLDARDAAFDVYRGDPTERNQRIRLTADPLRDCTPCSWFDPRPPMEETLYWLRNLDAGPGDAWLGPAVLPPAESGSERLTLAIDGAMPLPGAIRLQYELPRDELAKLSVHDVQGRMVRTLLDRVEEGGRHTIAWDGLDEAGRTTPAGFYIVRLTAGTSVRACKLLRAP